MDRVFSSLATEHDLKLVLVAILVCAATIFSSFKTYAHALDTLDSRRQLWLVLTGICSACGIWATHFVAMVAYEAHVAIGFDPTLTGLSFLVGAFATTAGYWVAASDHPWAAAAHHYRTQLPLLRTLKERTIRAAAGGLIIGAGIGAIHFIGMQALMLKGEIGWNMPLSALSLVIGMSLTATAMAVHRQLGGTVGFWAGTGLMVLAICGLHFTAMGAITVTPDPLSATVVSRVDKILLAICVVGATAFVVGAGIAAMVIDRLKDDLAQHMRELQAAHDTVSDLNVELANSILKLKDAQEEIVKRGKMAQLGQLTATVAHEIRNPLGAVKTAAYVLERMLKGKELGVENHLMRINNGITRCDSIISELLDFARSRALALKTHDASQWVETAVKDEAKSLPPQVTVTYTNGLPHGMTMSVDSERLRRVIINLLSNASEAMVGKGRDVPAVVTDDPRIAITTALKDGNIEIICKDNGPGITPEDLKRILEPLYTTKSFGVGLGLPAVQKILEQHGGGLRIESVHGEGATFTAWFPATHSAETQKAA